MAMERRLEYLQLSGVLQILEQSFWSSKVGWNMTVDNITKLRDSNPKFEGFSLFLLETEVIVEENP